MVNDHELPRSTTEGQIPERDRLSLYKDVLYREATSLLAQYLPEALPQEHTEVAFSIFARYEGKFRGTHYIAISSAAIEDLTIQKMNTEIKEDMKQDLKKQRSKETRQKDAEIWNEELMKLREDGEDIPDDAFIDVESVEALPDPEEDEQEKKEDNWDKLTGSLSSRQGYSVDTWGAVQTTIHELIHQRQEELNPTVSQDLSSPELDKVDLDLIDRQELWKLIRGASIVAGRKKNTNTLFWPVIEGMANVGSFYVMKRLEDDLIKAGDTESAAKINKTRSANIHEDTIETYRKLKAGKKDPSDYSSNYLEGTRLMRKLYKQFREATPRLLTNVDLQACQQITKGSPQYQQIMENPTLLPGLPQVAA